MSRLGNLEAGSRHDLLVGLSPDAPDEADFRDDGEGAFGYVHSYEFRPDTTDRASGWCCSCRVACFAAPTATIPIPGILKTAPTSRRSRSSTASARLRWRYDRLTAASPSRAESRWCSSASRREYWLRPGRWAFIRRSRHRGFSVTALTTGICRTSISCCWTSKRRSGNLSHCDRPGFGADAALCRAAGRNRQAGLVRFTLVPGLTDDPANVERSPGSSRR